MNDMQYIYGFLSNIFSLVIALFFVQVFLTWFILFPLFGLELWREDKNSLSKRDWDDYNKYAKDDDTITPEQWRKYGYAYREWYLYSQRNLPFWTWYERMKKKKRYMIKSWEYKKILHI